jgi:anaerobic carbon-monoxide dehydrogenase iron sulfur subunit
MKSIVVQAERCTGCESCVLSCSFAHDETFALADTRIQVDRDEERGRFRPRVCVQCTARPCLESCPVEALSLDSKTGAIVVSALLCIGCRQCAAACPVGGIHFGAKDSAPIICDLCQGEPACVRACGKPAVLAFRRRED